MANVRIDDKLLAQLESVMPNAQTRAIAAREAIVRYIGLCLTEDPTEAMAVLRYWKRADGQGRGD